MTLVSDHVAFHALRQPGRLAAIDLAHDRRWTYGDLDVAVGAAARLLAEAFGLAPGDRVACLSRNRVEIIVLHFACARARLIFTPLNWRLSTVEIAALIADTEPGLVVGDGELDRAGVAGLDIDALFARVADTTPGDPGEIDPSRPSLILFTSGTSGRPKGALLSERNLAQNAINFAMLGRVTADSVFLIDSPMFHTVGLVASVRPVLMMGGAIIVSDSFQPARTLQRLGDAAMAVTHYFCVPQMATLLRTDPSFDPAHLRGLTGVFTGGAPHPAAAILAWLDHGIPAIDGFGMSETGSIFGMPLDPAIIAAKAGSVGFSTPAVSARIVDRNLDDVPTGQPGELVLKGETVSSGYWRRPDETRAAFTEDGWFRTGDIAVVDADGFYRLVDRKKDMFISGGENVYPAEIEAALASFEGLAEVAIVGVADEQWGEVGVCIYVAAPDRPVSAEGLIAHLGPRLAKYKIPKRFVPRDGLPRTGSGKVLKGELRAWLAATRL